MPSQENRTGSTSGSASGCQLNRIPPSLPSILLRRPHLEARLGPAVAARLSMVTGPAGSGKSTLVRAWLSETTSPWAWITIDTSICEPDRFWSSVVQAVQSAIPGCILDSVDAVGSDEIDGTRLMEALVNDLVGRRHVDPPGVIVLDDAHLLSAACWQDLQRLVTQQIGLHFVVVSRCDPPLSMARFGADGSTTQVRGADLAFTAAESSELLSRCSTGGADWSGLTEVLNRRTGGWITGLRLCILSLQRGSTPEQLLARLAVAPTAIAELLVNGVLDAQPPELRLFLRNVSIVDVIEPALCDALTGRTDSRHVLRQLAADHVFVSPLEGQPEHFRNHPLLAEVLRLELQAEHREQVPALQLRAATWYADQGRYREAVEMALAGGHHEVALDLVVDHLSELHEDGRRNDIGRWLLAIPDLVVISNPDRAVDHCAALLFVTRPEWLRWLRHAKAIVTADRHDLLARLALFEALGWAGQGRVDEFTRLCEQARRTRPIGMTDPFEEAAAAWAIRLRTLAGDHEGAVEAAQAFVASERVLVRDLAAVSLLAATLHAAGSPSGIEIAHVAVRTWRELGEPDLLGIVDALCVASQDALARGEINEAENLAGSAVAITALPPRHLLAVRASRALAEVERVQNRSVDAHDRLTGLRSEMTRSQAAATVLALIDDALADFPPSQPIERHRIVDPLTDRERVVLGFLATHLTFPEIGRELYVSRHTVKTHVMRIYRKLGVTSRSGAISAAQRHGLL